MKNDQQHQSNVMANDAILAKSFETQASTAKEPAISPKLQEWVDFLELIAGDLVPVKPHNEVAPFIVQAEKERKAKAEKRLMSKLRKMEVEQKEVLLAEAQKSLEEARRKFESQPQVPYDYTPGPPSCIEDFFRQEKERNDLIALEREQKEELLRQVKEKRARECGDQWPLIQEMSQDPRFDHIPKRWPGYEEIMAKAFPGPHQ